VCCRLEQTKGKSGPKPTNFDKVDVDDVVFPGKVVGGLRGGRRGVKVRCEARRKGCGWWGGYWGDDGKEGARGEDDRVDEEKV
jgi:hypothetical protein